MNKPKFFYRRKLKKLLEKGKITKEEFDNHMIGMPYYRPPDKYLVMGKAT